MQGNEKDGGDVHTVRWHAKLENKGPSDAKDSLVGEHTGSQLDTSGIDVQTHFHCISKRDKADGSTTVQKSTGGDMTNTFVNEPNSSSKLIEGLQEVVQRGPFANAQG